MHHINHHKKFPILVENSKIPIWLSKISPIEIYAISFGFLIICRDKLSKKVLKHELIHYAQQKELYFVGQWFLYAYFFIHGLIKYKDGAKAYYRNPFEQEAYDNQSRGDYLSKRRKFAWKSYRI